VSNWVVGVLIGPKPLYIAYYDKVIKVCSRASFEVLVFKLQIEIPFHPKPLTKCCGDGVEPSDSAIPIGMLPPHAVSGTRAPPSCRNLPRRRRRPPQLRPRGPPPGRGTLRGRSDQASCRRELQEPPPHSVVIRDSHTPPGEGADKVPDCSTHALRSP